MKLHQYSNCESYARLDIKRVPIQTAFDLLLIVQRSSNVESWWVQFILDDNRCHAAQPQRRIAAPPEAHQPNCFRRLDVTCTADKLGECWLYTVPQSCYRAYLAHLRRLAYMAYLWLSTGEGARH
jgi:hypothetical protein